MACVGSCSELDEFSVLLDEPAGPALKAITEESFSIIGMDWSRVRFVGRGGAMVRSLKLIDYVSVHPYWKAPEPLHYLRHRLVPQHQLHGGELIRAIWAERPKPHAGDRRLLTNESEIKARLSRYFPKLESVFAWQFSLKEQAEMFFRADIIFGIMGANMVNSIFCRPMTPIVYFVQNSMAGIYYHDLASIFEMLYLEVRSRAYDPDPNANFTIEVSHVDDLVRELKKAYRLAAR